MVVVGAINWQSAATSTWDLTAVAGISWHRLSWDPITWTSSVWCVVLVGRAFVYVWFEAIWRNIWVVLTLEGRVNGLMVEFGQVLWRRFECVASPAGVPLLSDSAISGRCGRSRGWRKDLWVNPVLRVLLRLHVLPNIRSGHLNNFFDNNFFWEQQSTWKSCLSFFPDCLSFLRKSIISCQYWRENALFLRA